MRRKLIKLLKPLIQPVISIVLAFLIGAVMLKISGKDPLLVYKFLFSGAFIGPGAILDTLFASIPLILTGLASAVAFKSNIFNIGVEGQLYIGAFAAAYVGFTFANIPLYLHIPFCIIAGIIAGGIWGLIPGLLRGFLSVNEMVVTIMLNYVAILFTGYLTSYPFKAEGLGYAATKKIAQSAYLPRFTTISQLHYGFIIALIMVLLVYFYLKYTCLGLESKMIGLNPFFAEAVGMDVAKKIVIIMFISGAIGGLAGAIEVMGVHHRFIDKFSPGYGFDGITIALLGKNHPAGVLLAALFFGMLKSGGSTMEIMINVSRDIITILQGIIIFFLAVEFAFKDFRLNKWLMNLYNKEGEKYEHAG